MIKQHVSRTILFGIIGLLVGLGFAFFSRPVFEGRAQMVVGVTNDTNTVLTTLNEDVRQIIQRGTNSNVSTELQILRGKGLFADALKIVEPTAMDDLDKYYAMYDVLGDKESNLAEVHARMYDKEKAAQLANEITRQYNLTRERTARNSVSQAIDYLKSQIVDAQQAVARSEAKLRDYKLKNNVSDFQSKMLQLYSYRTTLQSSLDAATSNLNAVDAEIATLATELRAYKPKEEMGSQETKRGTVSQLEQDLELAKTRLAIVSSQYHDDAFEVRQVKEQINNIRDRLVAARKGGPEKTITSSGPNPNRLDLEKGLASARARKASLIPTVQKYESLLAKQDQDLALMPKIEEELTELGRDLQLKDASVKSLQAQLQSIENRVKVVPTAGTVIQPALPDKEPVAPEPAKLAFVGVAGGLAFGLLFSLGLESLRGRLYSSQQLSDLTGLPVVATVPLLPRPAARRMLQGLARKDGPLIESLRFLAFSSTAKPEEHKGLVMFTSNSDDSGCSTAAGQYAAAIARTGVRVLLVDGNLRQPTLSRVFSADSKSGVSDILSRSLLPSDQNLILETEQPNLRVLPAGSADENAIKEAPTANLGAFLGSLSAYGDMIVIDTPPCNIMADASRLAPYVDEVFLVVSAASASARNVPAASEILSRSGAKKVSLVMTHASPTEESFSRQADYLLSRS